MRLPRKSSTPFALLLILSLPFLCMAESTTRRPLSHDVYDQWQSVSGQCISADGHWVLYTLEPQEGDARLIVFNTVRSSYDTIARGTGTKLARDGKAAAFVIKPVFAEVKKAKMAKKKPEEMPKDSLGILTLDPSLTVVKAARVKSFAFPEQWSGWLAYLADKEMPDTSVSLKQRSPATKDADAVGDEKDKKDEKGSLLFLRDLVKGIDYRFPGVTEFVLARHGPRALFASSGGDSNLPAGVYLFSAEKSTVDTIISGRGTYKQLSLDEWGKRAAFVADQDTCASKVRYYKLFEWKEGGERAATRVDTSSPGMGKGWTVSENGKTWYSRDGQRLFFGTCPALLPGDTALVEEETAKLDVWSWQDELLQPQQLKSLDADRKRPYLACVRSGMSTVVQLADSLVPTVTAGNEGDADVALGLTNVPYRRQQSWTGDGINDAYLVDMNSGRRQKIVEGVKGTPGMSPRARYVGWYDGEKKAWFAFSTATGKTRNLTKGIKASFCNEEYDMPDEPSAYGAMGWTEGDSAFALYDRYDIWIADPETILKPWMLTRGTGRRTRTTFRYIRLDPDEKNIPSQSALLLKAFRQDDKAAGFYTVTIADAKEPVQEILMPKDFGTPARARDTGAMIVTRACFQECQNLYFTCTSLDSLVRISNANPQQDDFVWGSVELMRWHGSDGIPLEGLLYKPPAFEPKNKYPLVVYFYERSSDQLHRYFAPAPSASTVNPALYASRGYLVFIPDIKYKKGFPGKSAMNCVIPGVRTLIARGFVDSSRIGIQGQSWGGYQVAYIVAHTTMFRAAMAGAAVVNMTSAYGGIRWESGISRMFQYERAQSRIGGTLWQKPELFLENSPLFRADKIQTPLLLMNNDNDGAVPWYQGIEFFTALRRLGKPVWLLNYNGEEHNLVQRKNRKDLSIRMLQFFDHYLTGAPAPAWMERGIPALRKGKSLGYETVKPVQPI